LNPGTSPQAIEAVMDEIDLILVMSVNPGFGGQRFIDSSLTKIARLRHMINESGRAIDLEVDGGVTPENAGRVVAAGANVLVAGSAAFVGGPGQYAQNIARLRAGGAS
jgi:ribulose-phosphate 3-epimerase